MKQDFKEEKKLRIAKKLETISKLYDLAFDVSNAKHLKQNVEFVANEKELVKSCKLIANQVKVLESKSKESGDSVYFNLSKRLIEVFKQTVDVIKDEFRTLRTRNNRLPQLDI